MSAAFPAVATGDTTTGLLDVFLAELGYLIPDRDVTADSHFFDDLGADSMLMARFCARVRKRPGLPSVSMRDIYARSTAAGLAAALAGSASTAPTDGCATPMFPAAQTAEQAALPPEGRTGAYLRCGAAQLVLFLGYTALVAEAATVGYGWITAADGTLGYYLRSVVVGAIGFVGTSLLPVAAKWLLIGRWTEQEIPLWSAAYLRFWVVRMLIRSNPLLLVAIGSPLLPLYLRALGARVGRGVTFLSRTVPVCTDLLTIGDGTVVRKDALVSGYRGYQGMIQTGPVRLGADVVVGESTVIDIGTVMEDGTQLGHSSSLHRGQLVPAGQSWHGTPARPCSVDYRLPGSDGCGPGRRFTYAATQLVGMLLVYLPLAVGGVDLLLTAAPQLTGSLETGPVDITGATFYRDAALISLLLVGGGLVAGLVVAFTVPRLLSPLIRPDVTYPLYGMRYSAQRAITRLTNIKFYAYFFGDSSYVLGYLRGLGHDLALFPQTGSNFGTGIKQDSPFHSSIGTGTMVADGLSIINADFSATSFRLSRTTIGAHSFFGNRIAYPVGARMGRNCLIATKAMVPLEGPVRADVGLLGSPCFEIPRTVARDATFDHIASGLDMHYRLRMKNRYNLRSMGLALLVRWGHVFGLTGISLAASEFYSRVGALSLAAEAVAVLAFTIAYFVLVERAAAGFRSLQPRFCSIYDPYFWRHERYWKLVVPEWEKTLAGTPFKNLVSWLLGVRMGRRVFDDGCFLPERTLVTIGNDCVLNAGTVIQCHSQEDGTFKSDRSALGAGVTLGVGAFAHYGVTIGDGAVLGPDSFLMKGEEVPAQAVWEGNPAHPIPATRPPVRP